jgi:hypothetical protein
MGPLFELIESVSRVLFTVRSVQEHMAKRKIFLPMSPVQSVDPGMGIAPLPEQKSPRPASTAEPAPVDATLLLAVASDPVELVVNESPPLPPLPGPVVVFAELPEVPPGPEDVVPPLEPQAMTRTGTEAQIAAIRRWELFMRSFSVRRNQWIFRKNSVRRSTPPEGRRSAGILPA